MRKRQAYTSLACADDRLLADRAVDGDAEAFAVLIRRYTPMMRAYVRRLLPGTAEIDDVVQETFIAAWHQLPTLENPERVKSWLMRITSRKAIDRIRSARLHDGIDEIEPAAPEQITPQRQVEARAVVAALAEALQQLPAAQRECWMLREVGGYTYEEISHELGIPLSTVRGLLARARKDIIVRMEQWR